MSDTATPAESDQHDQTGEDRNIALLREKAKRFDENEAALAASKRENAMLRSGIDLESPLGEFFVKSYDGDPADADALKAKATELGVPFKTAQVVETSTETAAETTAPTGTAERSALSDGAPADTGEDKHPVQFAKEQFDRRIAEQAPIDAAQAEFVHTLAVAAMQGDKRVIVEGV